MLKRLKPVSPIALPLSVLGNRLRTLRRRRKLTLEQLSELTGLNEGYLSRIESGAKSPSIASVIKLATVLETTTALLFGEQVAEDDIHVARAPRGEESGQAGMVPLSLCATSLGVETFLVHPAKRFEEDGWAEHPGTEGAYVLEGQIEIQFSDRTLGLVAGDYIQFPGHLTHQIRRISEFAAVLVIVSKA